MNEDKSMNIRLPFDVKKTMTRICDIKDGPTIMGAWGKDSGTMERRLKLLLVYPDGEISPIREYIPSKLSVKTLSDLADMDGVGVELVKGIYEIIMTKKKEIVVQKDGSGRCSLRQVYEELCKYVNDYEEPGKVFKRDGYGYILATYLPSVLNKLEMGYSRLEVEKNFKAWGLLRTSESAGHVYSVGVNQDGIVKWFFSFKLQPESGESGVAA